MQSKQLVMAICAMLAAAGCGGAKLKTAATAGELKPGSRVSLALTADGQAVQGIAAEPDAEAETEEAEGVEAEDGAESGPDCMDGLDAAGAECDGGPAANSTAGGAETATTANALSEGEVLVQRSALREIGPGKYEALGLTIVSGTLPEGKAVRFTGKLDANGEFVASKARGSGAEHAALKGRLESVERKGDGTVTLRLLGQALTTSEADAVEGVESLDSKGEIEDGVNCEQEGEQQGENEGCAAPAP